jgi:hypothetical protein
MSHSWPRFKSKKAWLDNNKREWHPAGPLPEWEELDIWTGSAWYILDRNMDFPLVDTEIAIRRNSIIKTLRVEYELDVSSDGFKRLVLISEVYSSDNF